MERLAERANGTDEVKPCSMIAVAGIRILNTIPGAMHPGLVLPVDCGVIPPFPMPGTSGSGVLSFFS